MRINLIPREERFFDMFDEAAATAGPLNDECLMSNAERMSNDEGLIPPDWLC